MLPTEILGSISIKFDAASRVVFRLFRGVTRKMKNLIDPPFCAIQVHKSLHTFWRA